MNLEGDSLTEPWVDRICDRLGIPGFVDVHVHFMPENVLAKVWAYFDAAGPLIGRQWPIRYRMNLDERLETLRSLGIRRCSALSYPHRPAMAEWLNEWSLDFAARHSQIARSATFYPEPGAPQYVEEALRSGTQIFKAHIQVGDYDPRDPLLDEVWSLLSQAKIPTVIHCGSGPVPGRFTGIEPIAELLRRYPRLVLIVAHMGDTEYEEFLVLAENYANVYLDTTMIFTPFTEARSPYPRRLLGRLGYLGPKIVLGSDFPNIPYDYRVQIEALEGLRLGDDWLRSVLWSNGLQLLGGAS